MNWNCIRTFLFGMLIGGCIIGALVDSYWTGYKSGQKSIAKSDQNDFFDYSNTFKIVPVGTDSIEFSGFVDVRRKDKK